MASNIFGQGRQQRLEERAESSARFAKRDTVSSGAPWEGATPGLPEGEFGHNFARTTQGLVAKGDKSDYGEVLTNDAGFIRLEDDDDVSLPLGVSYPKGGGSSDSTNVIVRLDEFPLLSLAAGIQTSNEATKAVALVSGDGSTAGSFEMYVLEPSSADWAEIPFSATAASAGSAASAGRDGDVSATGRLRSMPDSCVFHGGAAGRDAFAASNHTEAINQPAFIWTNNVDPVMVYPTADTTSGTILGYEPLSDDLGDGGSASYDFRCVSVATFGDRVYFFNTFENTVRYATRLRRSARGTCDPAPGNLGAGSKDLDTFAGDGLRVEPFGQVLACYLSDGTAFVRETGLATSPNSVQVLDSHRGLLGTHALASIGENTHFGIFDDGWWLLDSSGRWTEVGVLGDRVQLRKWKTRFYNILDPDKHQRLQCFYDSERNQVRISIPTTDTVVTENWIYDIASDRVWQQNYPSTMTAGGGATCWARLTVRDNDALIWSGASGDLWSTIVGSWASFGSPAGKRRLSHGTHLGFIFYHDENLITQDGEAPSWSYSSVRPNFGDPSKLVTIDRVTVEHINSSNGGNMTIVAEDTRGNNASGSIPLDDNGTNDVVLASTTMQLTAEGVGVNLSGSGAVRIRRIDVDYYITEMRRRS